VTWWVVQTESQREHTVRVLLERTNHECYFPRIKHHSRIAPFFPSYLFVRAVEQFYPVRWTEHVVRVLMSGEKPAVLAENIVANIRKREVGGFVKLPTPPRLRKGQPVRVIRGSFEGLLAIHQGMGSRERVWVLLNLMGQQVPVELPSRDIQPLPVAAQ